MTREEAIRVIADVLLDNWDLLDNHDGALTAVSAQLDWPPPDQYSDVWVVDGESPKSLAEKIVTALESQK